MSNKIVVIKKDGGVHGVYDREGNKIDFDVYDFDLIASDAASDHYVERAKNFEKVVNLKEKLGGDNKVLIRKLGVRPDATCDKFVMEVGYEFEGQLVNMPEIGKQLFAISDDNHHFRSSFVTKITDDHNDIVVETNNSIYLIEKRG